MQVTQFVKAKVPHRRQVPGPRRATCPAARGPLLPWEEMMRVCSYLKTWLNVRVTKALRNDKYIPYVSTLVTELIRPVQLKDYRNGSIWGIKVKTVRMSGCSPSLPTAEPGSGRALGAQVCDGPCVHASGCRSRAISPAGLCAAARLRLTLEGIHSCFQPESNQVKTFPVVTEW